MSIPYSDNLKWESYTSDRDRGNWDRADGRPVESRNRAEQFLRDLGRLVLKVPIRSIFVTPVFYEENWGERERCTINAKLTGYSFVQMLLVPVKWMVAIATIMASAISCRCVSGWLNYLHGRCENYTHYFDGCTSQLEALKEEGIKKAATPEEYNQYKEWVFEIDAEQAKKTVPLRDC